MRNAILTLLIALLAMPAFAKPMSIGDHIQATEPLGRGELHKLVFHVYSASFWTDAETWEQDKPYALYIKYFKDISKEGFLKRTLKELKRHPDMTDELLAEFERKLGFIYPDVVSGDSITALYTPDEGVLFCHNDNKLGWIKNPELIVPFFEIWLGEHTSEPELRKQLLGLK